MYTLKNTEVSHLDFISFEALALTLKRKLLPV